MLKYLYPISSLTRFKRNMRLKTYAISRNFNDKF
jgi:hypothetical protein